MIAISPKTLPSAMGLLLVLALHAGAIAFLRADRIDIAFAPVARLVTTHIIYEPHNSTQTLRLRVNLSSVNPHIEPPDVPGIQVSQPAQTIDMPLVKIGARFESGFDPQIPIKEVQNFQRQSNTAKTLGLSIQIYEDGSIGEVIVEHGSDLTELDRFIANYAKQHWRFMAATQDGTPVASWKSIDVVLGSGAITIVPR